MWLDEDTPLRSFCNQFFEMQRGKSVLRNLRKSHFEKKLTRLLKKESENKQNNKSHGSLLRGDSWEGERRKRAKKPT